MTKRYDYEIRSTYQGDVTGRAMLMRHTRAAACRFARQHSRAWKTRMVHVLTGNFPIASFQAGKEVPIDHAQLGTAAEDESMRVWPSQSASL